MKPQQLWQHYQNWLYFNEELGLYLDVSRMRFDDSLLENLKPKFDNAFQLMSHLEHGAIANPDENRMVGHYWLRDPEIAPVEFQEEIIAALDQVDDFGKKIHAGIIHPPTAAKFTDVLAIGIGGSALGPQFVADALTANNAPMSIHFIDNTDPAGIDRILSRLSDRLETTLVIVTSKSGGTIETRNGMLEIKHAYEQRGLDFPAHAVAVTMLGSSMDELERMEGWLAEFPMFDWVGGRTSEMSAVGLLSARLLGIDFRAMLDGAKTMDKATRTIDVKNNPAALLAMSWYHAGNGKGEKDMVILPYKDSLILFSRYLQQLIMESLGKGKDLDGNSVHQGITVYGNKGSTDQHAFVQQLRDGIANFFVTFIEVLEDRVGESIEVEPDATTGDFLSSFLQGTREALYENQRASITLTIPAVDARSIGALIALYERAVGIYAALININAYDQPGVEAGKKASVCYIDLQRKIFTLLKSHAHPITLKQLAEQIEASEQIEAVYKVVRHMTANHRGIVVTGKPDKPEELHVLFEI